MLQLGILFLILVCSYILILKNFEYSVYLLMILSVLLHKELFSFYQWDLLPIRAFMIAMSLAGVTSIYLKYIRKGKIKDLLVYLKDPVFLSLLILWLIRGISIIFTANLQASLSLYAFFTTIIILAAYLYFQLKIKPAKVISYLRFYVILTFILSVFGYFQLVLYYTKGITIGALWSIPGNIARVGSSFWDVNHYGALLAASLIFLGYFILTDKGLKKILFDLLMFVSISGGLFLTNSRSAWIMSAVALLTFAVILLVRRFGLKSILYILLAIFLVSLPLAREYSIKSSRFRAVVNNYFHYRMDSFDSHMLLLTGSLQIFEKYPFLGGGYGSFFEHFSKTAIAPTYFGRDPAALNTRVPAHTIWGELVAETGIIGLTVYLVLFAFLTLVPLYISLKYKEKKDYLLGALIVCILIGWSAAGIFYSYNSEFFWIIILLSAAWAMGTIQGKYSMKEIFVHFLWTEKTLVFSLSLLAALLIFVGLGNNHLIPWDEAIYAKVAKNMVISNNYVTEYFEPRNVWYEKPPLYMWMEAGLMKGLGFNSWAAKLPSAFFGFGLVLVTYFLAKKLFGRVTGFISGFVLLTTTQYLYYSRIAMMDVTTAFFITLSLFLYYLTKEKPKTIYWVLSGISLGLGVMVKGVVGFLPLPIIFFYEIYLYLSKQQKPSWKLILNYVLMFLSSVVIFLPWHLEMYKIYGQAFINNYLIYHVWDRATTDIEDKGRSFWWYVVVLKVSMRLWFIALLGALPLGLVKAIKRDNRFIFAFIWALIIFLFFSISKSKLIWYVVPLYPILSVFVGYFIYRVFWLITGRVSKSWRQSVRIAALFLLVVVSLSYLFLNRKLAYPSDLTGPQADLLQMKDTYFGKDKMVYVDRMELPLMLFYTDGPFTGIDFSPLKKDRVPKVKYNEQLILLTKTGRYSQIVAGYSYPPQVVSQEGDWVLWYFNSAYQIDQRQLQTINDRANLILRKISDGNKNFIPEYTLLMEQKAILESRISNRLPRI